MKQWWNIASRGVSRLRTSSELLARRAVEHDGNCLGNFLGISLNKFLPIVTPMAKCACAHAVPPLAFRPQLSLGLSCHRPAWTACHTTTDSLWRRDQLTGIPGAQDDSELCQVVRALAPASTNFLTRQSQTGSSSTTNFRAPRSVATSFDLVGIQELRSSG